MDIVNDGISGRRCDFGSTGRHCEESGTEISPSGVVECPFCSLRLNFINAPSASLIDGVLEVVHDYTVYAQQLASTIGCDRAKAQPRSKAAPG